MSDFDEMDFDGLEDELEDAFEGDPTDDLTPEEIFKMVLLNKIKGTRVHVELKDDDGDTVDLPEVVSQLLGFMKDRLQEDSNQFVEQIMPLMSQATVSGLGRMVGIHPTAWLLANPMTRDAIVHMMCVAFLLLKFVQDHGLKIHTYEEEVSADEIEEIERKSKANSVATMGSLMGMDPREILKQMLDQGKITQEDLSDIMGDKKKDGDDPDDLN